MSAARRWVPRLALALSATTAACGSRPATRSAAPAGAKTPHLLATLPPELIDTGCISTGPERCFDATDDNCNGIIDEGCGLETGAVQFAIAWDSNADVDLLVTDPSGELAEVGRPSSSGLVKQRDCPGRNNECRGRNLENVYLETGEPPRGTYKVRIVLERLAGDQAPVQVRFGARVGPRSYGLAVRLYRPESVYDLAFVL